MNAEAAAAYFHSRPFSRVMTLLRQRLIDLGVVGGNAELVGPTKAEMEAIRAFLGKAVKRKSDGAAVLPLREFEAKLQQSRFVCGLREALQAYFGEPILTRKERLAQENSAWAAFRLRAAADAPTELVGFLEALRSDWRQDAEGLERDLALVFRALAALPRRTGTSLRLPVFANRIAGDPHAFDAERPAGRLLVRALAQTLPIADATTETDGNWRSMLLAGAGLERDDLSSTVLAAGLTGNAPLLLTARQQGVALAYPLRTVRSWDQVGAAGGLAYVVENPAVFGAMLDHWEAAGVAPEKRSTVICTSGQLSAAGVVLLDRLALAGVTICYSGDFDVGGLRIARGLLRQYGTAVRLWRMDANSYALAAATGGRAFLDAERKALHGLQSTFAELVDHMQALGMAAYQEALAPLLIGDMDSQPIED